MNDETPTTEKTIKNKIIRPYLFKKLFFIWTGKINLFIILKIFFLSFFVIPKSNNLSVEETNVHIEARVNWDSLNIPEGTPAGGFVPFLKISSVILNQSTGLKTFVDLTPHINLIDNFHYARNIALPGKVDDLYTVEFKINPPHVYDLAFHKDWAEKFGKDLFKGKSYTYQDVDFEEIAKANRE